MSMPGEEPLLAVSERVRLRWLYEQTAAGMREGLLSNFWLGDYARYFTPTSFFTIAEIDEAARWLTERSYLAGVADRPVITEEGEKLVENGRSASADPRAVGSTHITVTGSSGVNIASHSPGATQAAVVTMTSEARRHLLNVADYLDQTGPQLGIADEQAAQVPELINELRSVADSPEADRAKLADLLDTVRLLAVGVASVPLGAGLEALVLQAIHALGYERVGR